jgi:hypothetical protein
VAADDERLGGISLWTSIVGLVLPVLLAMVFAVLLGRNILREPGTYYGLCLLLIGVFELVPWDVASGHGGPRRARRACSSRLLPPSSWSWS